ncbi:MAG: nucleotidyltransferase family protein [Clostridia bacterium]|nr:nucleotidyltransferase family protein [Clostridia bacterium]
MAVKTVAVIAEYNPFHKGHEFQLKEIRRYFGNDTVVVAIMSGNFVQRGEPAMFNKYFRAECAVRNGVNLVLELPPPYSFASARDFGRASVAITDMLGCIDTLVFGTEDADENMLTEYVEKSIALKSERIVCESFQKSEQRRFSSEHNIMYPVKPNDILASEYMRALKERGSSTGICSIRRTDRYSAGVARKIIEENGCVSDVIPEKIAKFVRDARRADQMIYQTLAFHSAMNSSDKWYCCGGGEAGFIRSVAAKADGASAFFHELSCGRFSRAHLRRAVLACLLGVSDNDVRKEPEYTVLLGSDDKGRAVLRRIRKLKKINIVTRPAETGNYVIQKAADTIYSEISGIPAEMIFRFSPFTAE